MSRELPAFSVSRSGRVHEYQCLSITHDGPCWCPLVLGFTQERTRPLTVALDQHVDPRRRP